ncbi:MFS general substrate transporter [Nemania sp. FL0916]|nr:MFS general substrate transporter [Nemania sp. FL0916]
MPDPDNHTESATAEASLPATLHYSAVLEKTSSQNAEAQHEVAQPAPESESKEDTKNEASTAPGTSDTPTASDDEENHQPWRLVLLTIALCFALFLVSLDSTILATAIPSITVEFDSLGDVAWYASSYLFAVCALQLLYGKLFTMYSAKWVFIVAVVLFEVGSVVAGVSPSSAVLIVGRAISGAGAAGIFAGAIILVAMSVPLRQRPLYTGILSTMHGIASVIGPLIGGVFTDHLTWRWCFYINLPFGGVAIIVLVFFLPDHRPTAPVQSFRNQIKQFDLPGTFFLIPSVISLLLALQWGGAKYPWSDGRIIALFVVFGVFGIIFGGIEFWQKDQATVPLRFFKNKNIVGALWYGVWLGAGLFVFSYYLPIWFQAIQGVSATQSGIRVLPSILGIVVFSIIGGGLATTFGQYVPLLLVSSVISAVGCGLLSTLQVDSGIGYWVGYQIIMAAGAGLGVQNVLLVAQVAVPKSDMAMATSFLTFTQTLSSSIFLAVAQTIFQNRLISNLTTGSPQVDPASVIGTGATGFRKSVSVEQLPSVLRAYNSALIQTFYLGVAASALSVIGPIMMDWISLKTPQTKENENGAGLSSQDSQSARTT